MGSLLSCRLLYAIGINERRLGRSSHIHFGYPERLCYLLSVLGMLLSEGPEQAEAAADHHVAVGNREVRGQPAASQLSALRARNGDYRPLRFPIAILACRPVGVVGAMTLRAKDFFVRSCSCEQPLGKVLDLLAGHFPCVGVVQRHDSG